MAALTFWPSGSGTIGTSIPMKGGAGGLVQPPAGSTLTPPPSTGATGMPVVVQPPMLKMPTGGADIAPPVVVKTPPAATLQASQELDANLGKPAFDSKYLWNIDGQNVALYHLPPFYIGSSTVSDAGDAETGNYSTNLALNNTLLDPANFYKVGSRLFVDLKSFNGKIYEIVGQNKIKSTNFTSLAQAEAFYAPPIIVQPPVVSPPVTEVKPPIVFKPVVEESAPPTKAIQPVIVTPPTVTPPTVTPPTVTQTPLVVQQPPVVQELSLPTGQVITSDRVITSQSVSAPLKSTEALAPAAPDQRTLVMAAIAAVGIGYFVYKAKGVGFAAAAGGATFLGVQKIMS